jgi:hypothetical protein
MWVRGAERQVADVWKIGGAACPYILPMPTLVAGFAVRLLARELDRYTFRAQDCPAPMTERRHVIQPAGVLPVRYDSNMRRTVPR